MNREERKVNIAQLENRIANMSKCKKGKLFRCIGNELSLETPGLLAMTDSEMNTLLCKIAIQLGLST